MSEQPTTKSKCCFMIGTEPIQITSNKHNKHHSSGNEGGNSLFGLIGTGVPAASLNSADSAWLAEILFTRRRHLSQPVFSANSHRRYSATKRRLQRRSLPTISEYDLPHHLAENEDDEGVCFFTGRDGSSGGSDPGSPVLSASSSGSSSGSSDDDDFVQKWNKIATSTTNNNSHHLLRQHHLRHHSVGGTAARPTMSCPAFSSTTTSESSYYELFQNENESGAVSDASSLDDCFVADLSQRLEMEAAAKRKDAAQRYYGLDTRLSSGETTNIIGEPAPIDDDNASFKVARLSYG